MIGSFIKNNTTSISGEPSLSISTSLSSLFYATSLSYFLCPTLILTLLTLSVPLSYPPLPTLTHPHTLFIIIIRCPLSVHLLPSPLSNPTVPLSFSMHQSSSDAHHRSYPSPLINPIVSLSFLLYPFSLLDDTICNHFSLFLVIA